jgi:hypothetical protein
MRRTGSQSAGSGDEAHIDLVGAAGPGKGARLAAGHPHGTRPRRSRHPWGPYATRLAITMAMSSNWAEEPANSPTARSRAATMPVAGACR